jgi:hypothetical protein
VLLFARSVTQLHDQGVLEWFVLLFARSVTQLHDQGVLEWFVLLFARSVTQLHDQGVLEWFVLLFARSVAQLHDQGVLEWFVLLFARSVAQLHGQGVLTSAAEVPRTLCLWDQVLYRRKMWACFGQPSYIMRRCSLILSQRCMKFIFMLVLVTVLPN